MHDDTVAPAIAGLAAGIAFVVVFSFLMNNANSPLPNIPKVSEVIIPAGAYLANSSVTFEPQTIKVILGYNNTIRWINNDSTIHFISADNLSDFNFWNSTGVDYRTNVANQLHPQGQFEFTFNHVGVFGYHSKPWLRGTIVVLPSYIS